MAIKGKKETVKKEITLEDVVKTVDSLAQTVGNLALEMREGFKRADDATEDLARIVSGSFKLADEKMDAGFKLADEKMTIGFKRADDATEDLARIVSGSFDKMDARIASHEETNSMEHTEIKTHLNNMAYRFELNELGRRVTILEKKVK